MDQQDGVRRGTGSTDAVVIGAADPRRSDTDALALIDTAAGSSAAVAGAGADASGHAQAAVPHMVAVTAAPDSDGATEPLIPSDRPLLPTGNAGSVPTVGAGSLSPAPAMAFAPAGPTGPAGLIAPHIILTSAAVQPVFPPSAKGAVAAPLPSVITAAMPAMVPADAVVSVQQIQDLLQQLDPILADLEQGLEAAYADSLPILGKTLSNEFATGLTQLTAFRAFEQKLTAALQGVTKATTASALQTLLNNAIAGTGFGPGITVQFDGSTLSIGVGESDSVKLSQQIDPHFGLPGLNFTASGTVKAVLSYSVGFTASDGPGGFSFAGAGNGPLSLTVSLSAPTLTADTSTLGFLHFNAKDLGSTVGATFSINQSGNPTLSGSANLDVQLKTDLGTATLPSFGADLGVGWNFGGGAPSVSLDNVGVDFGSYVTNFLKPILDDMRDVIAPLKPLIDFFETDIKPFESLPDAAKKILDADGDGKITLLDFLKQAGGDNARLADVIAAFDTIENLAAVFDGASGGSQLTLGSFTIPGDITASSFDPTKVDPSGGDTNWQSQLAGLGAAGADVSHLLGADSAVAGAGFSFPILDNPSQAAQLLLGGNVSLFNYQMPEQTAGFGNVDADGNVTSAVTLLPFTIFPGLEADFTGALSATLGMDFGYDTSGLKTYAQGGFSDPTKIFNGFYIADPTDGSGNPIPMLTFGGALGLEATLGFKGVADISGGGDIGGVFNIALANGGKEYLYQVGSAIANGHAGVLFDEYSRVVAQLNVSAEIAGISLGSISSDPVVLETTSPDSSGSTPSGTVFTGAADTDFETAGNWSPHFTTVSDGTKTGQMEVFGDTTMALGVSVTFNGPFVADLYSLQLAKGSALALQSGTLVIDGSTIPSKLSGPLTVYGAALILGGFITNAGTISADNPANVDATAPEIGILGVAELSGKGHVTSSTAGTVWTGTVFVPGLKAAPSSSWTPTLANDSNTIDGMGTFDVEVRNNGLIAADKAGYLILQRNVTNTGLLEATGPGKLGRAGAHGTLELRDGTLTQDGQEVSNAGGTIEAVGGGTVIIGGGDDLVTVHGGELLSAVALGLLPSSFILFDSVTLDGGTAGLVLAGEIDIKSVAAGQTSTPSAVTLTGLIRSASYGTSAILTGSTPAGDLVGNGNYVSLFHATIQGGELDARGPANGPGGTVGVELDSTLDGASALVGLDGTLHVGQVDNPATLRVDGSIAPGLHGGAIEVTGGTIVFGNADDDSASLGGPLAGADAGVQGLLTLDGAGDVVTGLDAASTLTSSWLIEGSGDLGHGQLGITNAAGGTIAAAGTAGLTVTTGALGLANQGLIESNGAVIGLASNVRNQGGTILANGGFINLGGTDIAGGEIETSGSGTVFFLGNTTLDGTAGAITLDAGANVVLARTQTLTGDIVNKTTLPLAVLATNSQTLDIAGDTFLTGGGSVAMNGALVTGFAAGDTLDNVDNVISGTGQIGGLTLINEAGGLIEAVGGTLIVDAAVSNSGTMTAAAGATLAYADGTRNDVLMQALGGTLDLGGAVANTGGTIAALNGGGHHSGTVLLDAIDLTGGVLATDTSDAASLILATTHGGTLDGTTSTVTLAASGKLNIANNADLTLTGTIANLGTVLVQADGANSVTAGLWISGLARLTGGGLFSMADLSEPNTGWQASVIGVAAANTLDNADNTIAGDGIIGNDGMLITNEAAGLVEASGGTLRINLITTRSHGVNGKFTNLGRLEAVGGMLDLFAPIANMGGTISALNDGAGHSGIVLIDGAVISGGVFATDTTDPISLIEATGQGGTLDGTANAVTLATGAQVQVPGRTSLTLTGSISNAGTIAVLAASSHNAGATLWISGVAQLGGGGRITLSDTPTSGYPQDIILGTGTADTLDNIDNTLIGFGQIGDDRMSLTNEARGVIEAQGGTLYLHTRDTAINLGVFEAVGGTLDLAGTIDNAGGQITALDDGAGHSGAVVLDSATVQGGTLASDTLDPTSVITVSRNGTLDGTVASGTPGAVTVSAGGDVLVNLNDSLRLLGSIVDNGTVSLIAQRAATYYENAALLVSGLVRLAGDGSVVLADSSGSGDDTSQIITGSTSSDTLDLSTTIAGVGEVGADTISVINEAAGEIAASGGTLILQAVTHGMTNLGLLHSVAGGTLDLRNDIANVGGTIAADGGFVLLDAVTIRGGTLRGGNGGQIVSGSGTLDGSASAVTILKGASVGVLAFYPSPYGGYLDLKGSIVNHGTLFVQGSAQGATYNRYLTCDGLTQLSGGGDVVLSDLAPSDGFTDYLTALGSAAGGDTLDNLDNFVSGFGWISRALEVTNETRGLISAHGGTLIAAGGVTNHGTMRGFGGTLDLRGSITNTGMITALNDGAGHSGIVLIDGATIAGGILASDLKGANSLIQAVSGGTLDGTAAPVRIATGAHLLLPGRSDLTLSGSIANHGTISIDAQSGATTLAISGTVHLDGGGHITMFDSAASGGFPADKITARTGSGDMLDNIDNTVSGIGWVGVNNDSLALTNEAKGLIRAQGGDLYIGGVVTRNLGKLEGVGGTLDLYQHSIDNAGGSLAALNDGQHHSGFVYIDGATVAGGTLATDLRDRASLIEVSSLGGTLDGRATPLTVAAGAQVLIDDQNTLALTGHIVDRGTITVTCTVHAPVQEESTLAISGTAILSGGGYVTLRAAAGDGPASQVIAAAIGQTTGVTLDNAGVTILGVGDITVPMINGAAGQVIASGGALQIQGVNVTNTGLLSAVRGALLHLLGTTIANAGGTITANRGTVELEGATISGGTIARVGGGAVIARTGTLDGTASAVTIAPGGLVEVLAARPVASDDSDSLTLRGTITNQGTLLVQGDSSKGITDTRTMSVSGLVRLGGGGTLVLADAARGGAGGATFLAGPAGSTLDNRDNLISGVGVIGQPGFSFTNEAKGVVLAHGGTLEIAVGAGSFTNLGSLAASGGTLELTSNTTLDNHLGVISAITDATGHAGVVLLDNFTVQGGTFTTVKSSLILVQSSVVLDGTAHAVTLSAGSQLQIATNSTLDLAGTIDNAGTIGLRAHSAASGLGVALEISGTVELTGRGEIAMSDDAGHAGEKIIGQPGASAGVNLLDNASTIAGAGRIGDGNFLLTNAGLIEATSATDQLTIDLSGLTLTNLAGGHLLGRGVAGLAIRDLILTNSGTVEATDGSSVTFGSDAQITGLSSGTLTGGSWIAAAKTHGATLDLSGGPIVVDAANIALSGTGSVLASLSGGTDQDIATSLTTVAAGGTLQILGGRGYASRLALTDNGRLVLSGGTFAAAGLTLGTGGVVVGTGTIADAVSGPGEVAAKGGLLTVAGDVTGSGSLVITGTSTLELGGSAAETVHFTTGAAELLKLDAPARFIGGIAGLALGDAIDFAGALASGPVISSGSLSVTVGGTLLSFAVAGALAGNHFALQSDGAGGTELILTKGAAAVMPGGGAAFASLLPHAGILGAPHG